jgi:hypothetical protein
MKFEFTPLTHFVKIIVAEKQGRDPIHVLLWRDLPSSVRIKYDWYFKYRTALFQVQYPRHYVEMFCGNEEAQGKQLHFHKLNSAKREVTKWQNILSRIVENHSGMFPVEDDPYYKKAHAKLQLKQIALNNLLSQTDQLCKK